MYFCLSIWQSDRSAICLSCPAKSLLLNNTHKKVIPLFVACTMAEGHKKVSGKSNLLVTFFCTLLNWSGWNLILFWSILILFYKIIATLVIKCKIFLCFVWMHLYIYKLISFTLGMMIEISKLCILYWSEWPWPSFQATVIRWSKTFCASYLTMFTIDLYKICYAVETQSQFGEDTKLYWFSHKLLNWFWWNLVCCHDLLFY